MLGSLAILATNSSCSMTFNVDQIQTTKTDCACTPGVSGSTWVCTAGSSTVSCPVSVGVDPTGVSCTSGTDSVCTRVFNIGPAIVHALRDRRGVPGSVLTKQYAQSRRFLSAFGTVKITRVSNGSLIPTRHLLNQTAPGVACAARAIVGYIRRGRHDCEGAGRINRGVASLAA
jgi:hypothetical protein